MVREFVWRVHGRVIAYYSEAAFFQIYTAPFFRKNEINVPQWPVCPTWCIRFGKGGQPGSVWAWCEKCESFGRLKGRSKAIDTCTLSRHWAEGPQRVLFLTTTETMIHQRPKLLQISSAITPLSLKIFLIRG